MNIKIEPIKLNQQGGDVYLLHQVLSAFGFTVSSDEASQGLAGNNTQTMVMELQKDLGVTPSNNAPLLDEKTIAALGKAMVAKGFLSSSRSFTASGNVKSANGKIKKQQQLIAYDLDLRGVGVYRDLKSLAELEKNNTEGGFDYLGKAVTDNKGNYSFTFFEFQYRRAERQKADIVVFALDKESIIGRSQLVNVESYDDKGFVRDVDIIIDAVVEEEKTEYQRLWEALTPFLDMSNLTFSEIAHSNDQVSFTAREIEFDVVLLETLAKVEAIVKQEGEFETMRELLYGLGRQDIELSWDVLFKKHRDELQTAIGNSVDSNIIAEPSDRTLGIFLDAIKKHATQHILNDKPAEGDNQLNLLLTTALPEEPQRIAFLKAVNEFEGSDFPKFWKGLHEKPEFEDKPELISGIQLTQQLHSLTNFQPLVEELQKTRGIQSVEKLIDLDKADWGRAITAAGIPDFIEGEDDKEKIERYTEVLVDQLNSVLPTQRIAKMIRDDELVFEEAEVQKNLSKFLKNHKDFDFKTTQIHKYIEDNKDSIEPSTLDAVTKELMELQRLFQVSTSPAVLKVLRENKLNSAYAIANIPRDNFINTYGKALGGADIAIAIHNRGQSLAKRAETNAMVITEASADSPAKVMSGAMKKEVEAFFEEKLPNYKNLFGSPDLCECKHCRSVFSPAAYFVELLRFMEKSTYTIEKEGGAEETHSPYEYLVGNPENDIAGRRPDLAKLELSCDNTNTLIPYIDLSNEVMESYVVAGSLETYDENIKDVTADELRANPQHTNTEAYRILSNNHEPESNADKKTAFYPFNLPFHQPLHVIRTYSDFLNVSRYETLQAVNPEAEGAIQKAIAAEALGLSEEEYRLLVGEDFEEVADNTELYQLFGYDALTSLDDLIKIGLVQKFMAKTQISYVELIELVNTKYINPYQSTIAYLDHIFSETLSVPKALYKWLEKMAVGEISESEPPIIAALEEHNANRAEGEPEITRDELVEWAENNFDGYKQVITLFEHYSACNLDTTRLRSIQGIEKFPDDFDDEEKLIFGEAKIELDQWSRFHDFIRLWIKLGWSIHEVDLMLTSLGEEEITPETISKLESILLLQKSSKLSINKLAVLWGDIDTYGEKSLYKQLFLNKAVQEINDVFKADAQGNYLVEENDSEGNPITLAKYQSDILAAFRISAGELQAILDSASMAIDDMLIIENLSSIYRYVVLAKSLKLSVKDLCKLIDLFDVESNVFASPENTYDFYQLAISTKAAKFKPSSLDYIFTGNLPADSTIGLDPNNIQQVSKTMLDGLDAIDQNYQQKPDILTTEIISAFLSFSFEEDVINRLIGIAEGTVRFEVTTDTNLTVVIPDDLIGKYSYDKGTGQFTCIGIMTVGEQNTLKPLFNAAVDKLFKAPEIFLSENFGDILEEIARKSQLLDRPAQAIKPTLNEKLDYLYTQFLPHVKLRLQHDVVSTHIANLIDLGEISTILLIEKNIDEIISNILSQEIDGFVGQITILHRTALFISGFKLSETEVKHFISFASDFGDIDFSAITPANWKRIRDYVELRNSVPQAQALLTDVFALANQTNPVATKDDLQKLILQATAWDKGNLQYLIDVHFGFIIDEFKNEVSFNKISVFIRITQATGLSAETVVTWGSGNADFDALHISAQTLKNAVKAKYSNTKWLEVAGGLSDKIREQQKQALISYLLVQDSIKAAKVKDADGLFEHLLIDVQMGACMDTSRIVQANAAIQLFVNRILLNLEGHIPPDAIDAQQWEWMKNYRVWEANRKVFLYPENWLEPEWRNDRSEFFKDLESHLLQTDITERSVEQGLRNYLMSMDEVSNLDVCGMYQENYEDGKLKFLHVFGRTHNLPYKYFYRRWNEYEKWSAWEKVGVDIRAVEDGKDSGVHLIPVAWKGRLFLFWPEFMEKAEASVDGNKTPETLGGKPVSELNPKKYWEIRLAWSEYVDRAWSAKQVSKEMIKTNTYYIYSSRSTAKIRQTIIAYDNGYYFSDLRSFRFTPKISAINNTLSILINYVNYQDSTFPSFVIADIQSKISIYRPIPTDKKSTDVVNTMMALLPSNIKGFWPFIDRTNFYMSSMKPLKLPIQDEGYFKTNNSGSWKLTGDRYYSGNMLLNNQFFIANKTKNYFAKSEPVTIIDRIKNPDHLAPLGNRLLVINTSSRQHLNLHADVLDLSVANTSTTSIPFSPLGNQRGGGSHTSKELTFHIFHHPFTSQFVTNLDSNGLSGLMSSDTSIQSDDGAAFGIYDPNFKYGFVHKTPSSDTCTGYEESICFDKHDANSLYNWELFFHAPLYIATRLSKNGKYKEAMQWFHYIFDPTTNEKAKNNDDTARYWKVKPFKAESEKIETLEQWFKKLAPNSDPENTGNKDIDEWRKNPFDPHLVAGNRPVAYMKHVVIKYIENLTAWGDSLFRQFTRESVYEAIQLYVIASHVLGKRPELVPKRGKIKTETYANLRKDLDDFGNALVELENLFPYSGGVSNTGLSTTTNILGIGEALYFCIPANDKLMEYWDTVADRLFKIRHCQDIDGVERSLALFAPPIDPAALIQARSQGLSLGSILADLSSPPPLYRFNYLLQKANEFCGDVKALGSALLSAIEKKDAEELSRLRASQEIGLLEQVTAIRERQVLSARASKENLLTSRDTAKSRLDHYTKFSGNNVTVPDAPDLEATLSAHSDLPKDTQIDKIDTGLTEELTGGKEKGVTLIPREKEELMLNNRVKHINIGVNSAETLAATLNAIPTFKVFGAPLGVGAGTESGGFNWANGVSAGARAARGFADYYSTGAILASRIGGYLLREDDRAFQANNAIREIISLDKQCVSADIQIQIAIKELKNHKQQIENAQQTEDFLKTKFSNQELYQWMKDQIYSVYKQSYNLAYDMAKKAEKAYQFEMGTEISSFIQYGYWDNSKQGLVSGEKLQLALRQLESSFLDNNRRELELSKNISLVQLNPLALIELRETGKCFVSLSEELFDLDFQGHYFRRIRAVSLSIPCVTGPYTNVNCSLRLLKNTMRLNTLIENDYEHNNEEGLLLDDSRFRTNYTPVTLIATSSAQNDAGMFEFNFRDERYLPFEGSGVISDWEIELSTDEELRQFDYSTISDVLLHIKYTARESAGTFKNKATEHVKEYFKTENTDYFLQVLNLKQDFSTEWHQFLHPSNPDDGNVFELKMSANLFPILNQGNPLAVNALWVFARFTDEKIYKVVLTQPSSAPETITLSVDTEADSKYAGLHTGRIPEETSSLEIKLQPGEAVNWQLKMSSENSPETSVTNKVKDFILVLGYRWDE